MEKNSPIRELIISSLKNIIDPDLGINIFDLGLIYNINISDTNDVVIDMTLTATNCPMAETLIAEVNQKINLITEINSLKVNLVFEPLWNPSMMSDEAKFHF